MTLPNFDQFCQALIESKTEDQSWGDFFAEIEDTNSPEANGNGLRQYIAASGLVKVLSEWEFYSSPSLDFAANNLGVKSWQITEFVESLRDSLSITESDLVIYEQSDVLDSINPSIAGNSTADAEDDANNHQTFAKMPQSLANVTGKSSLRVGLIVVPSLLAGALAMALLWVLSNRQMPPHSEPGSLAEYDGVESFNSPPPVVSDHSGLNTGQWQACKEDESRSAPMPQPGDVWWPVVGPRESLAASRQFCRADAFINKTGNVQIASFRDRATAESFARELSGDPSHSYRFRLGEPSYR
jgi:hypothetical protein